MIACGSHPQRVPRSPGPYPGDVRGALSDVHVTEGVHPGGEVYRSCKPTFGSRTSFSVIGTGTHEFPFLAAGYDATGNFDRGLMEAFRAQAIGAARVGSIHASGFGVPCRGDKAAFHLMLQDYRDVDAALEHLLEWFARDDLRGEVVLSVEPLPQLL